MLYRAYLFYILLITYNLIHLRTRTLGFYCVISKMKNNKKRNCPIKQRDLMPNAYYYYSV